jgi:hypothetical protein
LQHEVRIPNCRLGDAVEFANFPVGQLLRR